MMESQGFSVIVGHCLNIRDNSILIAKHARNLRYVSLPPNSPSLSSSLPPPLSPLPQDSSVIVEHCLNIRDNSILIVNHAHTNNTGFILAQSNSFLVLPTRFSEEGSVYLKDCFQEGL